MEISVFLHLPIAHADFWLDNGRRRPAAGIYDNCKVTDWGCEPFSMWHLEGSYRRCVKEWAASNVSEGESVDERIYT